MSRSRRRAAPPRRSPNVGRTVSTASTRMIRALVGSIRRKSLRSVRCASSAIWPAISTPVGPGSDDDEGQGPLLLGRGPGQLGELEGAEDATAQLEGVVDRLHPGRVGGELVVAEPRLACAGGDEQRVVGGDVLAPEDLRGDRAGLEVDVGHGAEHDPGVLLAGQHLAGARGDLPLGEDAGRDLVEQRLEQVVGGPGDEGDLDVPAALERLRTEETSETGTDDDDSVGGAHGGSNTGLRRRMPGGDDVVEVTSGPLRGVLRERGRHG